MEETTVADNSTTCASRTDHYVQGTAVLTRVGRLRFPVFELRQDGQVLASMGRSGWIKVMLGRGQRVELADGAAWRVQALGVAGSICPAVFDADGRKVAISSLRDAKYGINGKDYGCILYASDKRRFSRADRWIMREYETELALFTRYPASVRADEPVHLGAVILAFALIRYGISGESSQRFNFRWNT